MSGGSEWSGCNNLIPPGFLAIAMPGRAALDPANKGRPAEDVVLEAIKKGHAQTQPFKTRSTKTRVTPPPGIPLRRKSPSGL